MRRHREIVDGVDRIFVWHLRHSQLFGLQESGEYQIIGAGYPRIIQLAGLGAHLGNEFLQRCDAQRCRYTNADHRIGDSCNRHEIVDFVGHVVVQVPIRGEC